MKLRIRKKLSEERIKRVEEKLSHLILIKEDVIEWHLERIRVDNGCSQPHVHDVMLIHKRQIYRQK